MNNSMNATMTKTLTELLYSVLIQLLPVLIDSRSKVPAVTEFLDKIQDSLTITKDQHTIAKTCQITQANKHHCPEPTYQVGDQVYLNMKNLCCRIKNKNRSTKLYPRFIGPFPIVKMIPKTLTYELELPAEYKIHPVFHSRFLKPAITNDIELFPEQEPLHPEPVFLNEEEYEVERILDHQKRRNQ